MTADDVQEMCRHMVAVAAGQREWNDTRESWLARAANRLGIDPARARAFWYRRVINVPAHEYLALKARAREAVEERIAREADMARLRAMAEKLREP